MWRALPNGFFLSEFVPNDKPTLVQYLQEKEISDLTLTIPYPYESKNADEWMSYLDGLKQRTGAVLQWAIRDEKAALVGAIGFSEFKPGEAHKAELGYWVAKPFWGKGIGTNAVKAACKVAFDELGLARVTATIFSHNVASEKLLIKAGFNCEGTMKFHYYKNEKLMDAKLFALTIPDDQV